jgi:hypothetical protein
MEERMRLRLIHLVPGLALLAAPQVPARSMAEVSSRPVVVELFSSQACSSCPPAEVLLTDLARRRNDVLPLSFHVTYWNNLGWRDPFSFPAATERQRAYAATIGEQSVYTPQMVVDGTQSFVGSDRNEAEAAIRRAKAGQIVAAPLHLERRGEDLMIDVGAGAGPGTVLLVGFDPEHDTAVGGGENGGRRLQESNVVRSIQAIGQWTGKPLRLEQPLPAGDQFAVLLQAPNGRIVGATRQN